MSSSVSSSVLGLASRQSSDADGSERIPSDDSALSSDVARLQREATRQAIAEQEALNDQTVQRAIKDEERRQATIRANTERLTARWSALLARWNSGDDFALESPDVRRLCQEGIPEALRGKVWPLLIGNEMRVTRRLYSLLCEKSALLRERIETRRPDEALLAQASAQARVSRRLSRRARVPDTVQEKPPVAATVASVGEEKPPVAATVASVGEEKPPVAATVASVGEEKPPVAATVASGDEEKPPVVVTSDTEGSTPAPPRTPEASTRRSSRQISDDDVRGASSRLRRMPLVGSESTIVDIDRDVPRTFPELSYFRPGSDMHMSLKTLLSAFACYRIDMGYTQGMSFVAATLLLRMPDEAEAFAAFANLMLRPAIFEAFGDGDSRTSDRFSARLRAFDRCFQVCFPDLFARLSSIEIEPSMVVAPW
jgi:hypothetical protein